MRQYLSVDNQRALSFRVMVCGLLLPSMFINVNETYYNISTITEPQVFFDYDNTSLFVTLIISMFHSIFSSERFTILVQLIQKCIIEKWHVPTFVLYSNGKLFRLLADGLEYWIFRGSESDIVNTWCYCASTEGFVLCVYGCIRIISLI